MCAMATLMNIDEDAYDYALKEVSKWYAKGQRRPFSILIIGETGLGKSTLINNLLGEDIAEVGRGVHSETEIISKHEASPNGIRCLVYDTPGLLDTHGEGQRDQETLREIEALINRDGISVVIFCFKITETRLTKRIKGVFQEYHKIGIPWNRTVIALTFADQITKADGPLCTHVEKWRKAVCMDVLMNKLGLAEATAGQIPFRPTALSPTTTFPGGERWFVQLWYSVLRILKPDAMMDFLMTCNKHLLERESSCDMESELDPVQVVVAKYNRKLTTRIKRLIYKAARFLQLLPKEYCDYPDEDKCLQDLPEMVGSLTDDILSSLPLPIQVAEQTDD